MLLDWLRKLGYISDERKCGFAKSANLNLETLPLPTTDDPHALHLRIQELEKQLENAHLKVEGIEIMIEIVEKELKIPFRKKSVTK